MTQLGAIAATKGMWTPVGAVEIATAESTSATSYAITNLTTPDRVQSVVLPAKGLLRVTYQAIWQNTVANNGKAAIFLGSTQVKHGIGSGAPSVFDADGPVQANDDGVLYTSPGIQGGMQTQGGVGAATEVTTGQIVGSANASAGPVYIFAAAGTYDVSIQFKNAAAGTLTVKNRHLWVDVGEYP